MNLFFATSYHAVGVVFTTHFEDHYFQHVLTRRSFLQPQPHTALLWLPISALDFCFQNVFFHHLSSLEVVVRFSVTVSFSFHDGQT